MSEQLTNLKSEELIDMTKISISKYTPPLFPVADQGFSNGGGGGGGGGREKSEKSRRPKLRLMVGGGGGGSDL